MTISVNEQTYRKRSNVQNVNLRYQISNIRRFVEIIWRDIDRNRYKIINNYLDFSNEIIIINFYHKCYLPT